MNKIKMACGGALLGAALVSSMALAAGAVPAAGSTPTVLPAIATPAAPAAALPALPLGNSNNTQGPATTAMSGHNGSLPGLDGLRPNMVGPIRGPGNISVPIPLSVPPVLDSPTTKAQRRS